MAKYFEKLGEMVPDNLVAGNTIAIHTVSGVIAAGEGKLVRGTVLAAGADGKLKQLAAGSSAASEVAFGILCDDVDATSEAAAEVYVCGQFNKNALITKEKYALSVADIAALRNGGIFIENVVG